MKLWQKRLTLLFHEGPRALSFDEQTCDEYLDDARFEKDLAQLCRLYDLDMKQTQVWRLYQLPYNPLVPWEDKQEHLEDTVANPDRAVRVASMTALMIWLGDIHPTALDAFNSVFETR